MSEQDEENELVSSADAAYLAIQDLVRMAWSGQPDGVQELQFALITAQIATVLDEAVLSERQRCITILEKSSSIQQALQVIKSGE